MEPQTPLITPPGREPRSGLPIPRTTHDIAWPAVGKAILVLVAATLAIHLVGLLVPIALEVVVALLLAAALTPPVAWLVRRGLSRALATGLVMGAVALVIAALVALVAPTLTDEGRALAKNLPDYVNRAQGMLNRYPQLNARLHAAAVSGAGSPSSLLPYLLTAGASIVTGVSDTIAVIAMTAYLLAGGERGVGFLLQSLPPGVQTRLRRATPDIIHVVSGYLLGQAITSLAFGVFTYVVLRLLGVPQPLLLGVASFVLDAVPILGIIVATVVPVLLAWTQSTATAIIVLALFLVYHQLESHVLVPRIYGRTLGISSLAVLVAVLVGYRLLGILGVLIALPIAAAAPAVRRAWRQEDLLAGTGLHLTAERPPGS